MCLRRFMYSPVLLALLAVHLSAVDEALLPIAEGAQPPLAYAVERIDDQLRITVAITALTSASKDVEPSIGVAGSKSLVLTVAQAQVVRGDHQARFTWSIPAAALISKAEDWPALRLGIDVRWHGDPAGPDLRHERYLHRDGRAPSAGLSSRAADWAPLDLRAVEQLLSDRRAAITIPLIQPMDGKYSLVIEDQAGKRIRNLAGGLPAAKGPLNVAWDGMDEDGQLVPVGTYKWRSIHHPGIVPEFAMHFANADEPGFRSLLSNHCHFTAAAANAELAVLAAVGTEGGFAMAAFDRAGKWKQGFNPILGAGWNAVGVALDDKYLYSVHDGEGWGIRVDKSKPGWVTDVDLVLIRFDLASGAVVDYPGGKRWSVLEHHAWGPGATAAALRGATSLAGVAQLGGRLYISSRAAEAILVVDGASGKEIDRIALASPGAITAGSYQGQGRLVALSAGRPLLIDVKSKTARPYFTEKIEQALDLAQLSLTALALREDGSLWLSDARSSTVRGVATDGSITILGTPGGRYTGAWQPERMIAPSGLAVLGDRLWVAEDRVEPKRAVAWDLATHQVVRQVFGNPAYGGPGGGFDPVQPTTWVGEGATWNLDPVAQTAVCTGILGSTMSPPMPSPMHWRWIRQDGRTWLLASGMLNHLDVLEADGTLRPVAAWAACHHFSYAYQWAPPSAFVEAYTVAYPLAKYQTNQHGRPDHGPLVLWVDRNGDGAMQREEFEFSGADNFAGGSWGHDQSDLTIRLPGDIAGKPAILALQPAGVDARGVPRYPALAAAIAAAGRATDPLRFNGSFRSVSSTTHQGDVVVLSEPMTAWNPQGKLLWRYRNDWSNVHGSHNAPLPEPGVIQGALFILGMAPLDATTDAFIINGNHGRFFAMTSDGLYLDEMFNDCRVAQTRDANLVGGECFGGVFGRADDGTFWLQTGGDGFRLYRVRGLDQLQRAAGSVQVDAAQVQAAQRRAERQTLAAAQPHSLNLPYQAKIANLDGTAKGWNGEALTWSKQGGRYRVSTRLLRDATQLYLHYEVSDDPSPWINNGSDWTLLFKTGDSVDLQLGTDPTADAHRSGPVPGDCRLLIAPMGTDNVAVLYRHRLPGSKQGVAFASPWRSETVDEVKRLASAKIVVRKNPDGYSLDAAIPLAELGWAPQPGKAAKVDLGVIYGDEAGTINLLRNYWANQATGLVNDVPGEIMLTPSLWGDLTVEAP